jgi:hypothetical protein
MKMTPVRLLAVLIISIGISGCASVVLHPIEKSDITKMPKGIAYSPEKDGWFISDYYLEQVVKAKVEK